MRMPYQSVTVSISAASCCVVILGSVVTTWPVIVRAAAQPWQGRWKRPLGYSVSTWSWPACPATVSSGSWPSRRSVGVDLLPIAISPRESWCFMTSRWFWDLEQVSIAHRCVWAVFREPIPRYCCPAPEGVGCRCVRASARTSHFTSSSVRSWGAGQCEQMGRGPTNSWEPQQRCDASRWVPRRDICSSASKAMAAHSTRLRYHTLRDV